MRVGLAFGWGMREADWTEWIKIISHHGWAYGIGINTRRYCNGTPRANVLSPVQGLRAQIDKETSSIQWLFRARPDFKSTNLQGLHFKL